MKKISTSLSIRITHLTGASQIFDVSITSSTPGPWSPKVCVQREVSRPSSSPCQASEPRARTSQRNTYYRHWWSWSLAETLACSYGEGPTLDACDK